MATHPMSLLVNFMNSFLPFILLFFFHAPSSTEGSFDYFKLTKTWPRTFCMNNPCIITKLSKF
ncbi:hypothetical protein CR513_40727, partial [Mucuna pruriens]